VYNNQTTFFLLPFNGKKVKSLKENVFVMVVALQLLSIVVSNVRLTVKKNIVKRRCIRVN